MTNLKNKNDYQRLFDDWHERDWRAELRRDRNHPSIVLKAEADGLVPATINLNTI